MQQLAAPCVDTIHLGGGCPQLEGHTYFSGATCSPDTADTIHDKRSTSSQRARGIRVPMMRGNVWSPLWFDQHPPNSVSTKSYHRSRTPTHLHLRHLVCAV